MNVLAIISERLKALGADGLSDQDECGCGLDDLAPCGSWIGQCVPAKEIGPIELEDRGLAGRFDHFYEAMDLTKPEPVDGNGEKP